jgi:hypothetical protein
MDDELLTGTPALVGVVLTRVDEGVPYAVTVDSDDSLVAMLFDDREEVVQQPLLELVEFSGRRRGLSSGRSRRGCPR